MRWGGCGGAGAGAELAPPRPLCRCRRCPTATRRFAAHLSPARPAPCCCSADLELLFLNGNPLGGTLSADWVIPSTLKYWLMDGCNLTGPLPNGWKLPQGLQASRPEGWGLHGKASTCAAAWHGVLATPACVAAAAAAPRPPSPGTHPPPLLHLQSINWMNNELSGTIPAEFAQIEGMVITSERGGGSRAAHSPLRHGCALLQPAAA